MKKFLKLTGVAAPLLDNNINTDIIIPKNYLRTIKKSGLSKGLFKEWRFKENGTENPDFILNKSIYRNSQILVVGKNFGCGSSREHAPWALIDFGIQCIISMSFANIFYNNCFKNGLLPICLKKEQLSRLFSEVSVESKAMLSIDLEMQTITLTNGEFLSFDISLRHKEQLMSGLDEISVTLQKEEKIKAYEDSIALTYPWV